MCFSATASFVSGTALAAAGVYCVYLTRGQKLHLLPLASIPLLFGAQQIAEGFVWHGLDHGSAVEARLGAKVFLFFAMGFWLFYIPLAASFVERIPRRRTIIRIISALGLVYGMSLYIPILLDIPGGEIIEVTMTEGSIAYYTNTLIEPSVLSNLGYVFFTPATLVATTHKPVQMFALMLFSSAVFTKFIYVNTWTSVWCFIAALLSFYLVRIIRSERVVGPQTQ